MVTPKYHNKKIKGADGFVYDSANTSTADLPNFNCSKRRGKAMNELKPCPFCGHTKPMLYDEREIGKGF